MQAQKLQFFGLGRAIISREKLQQGLPPSDTTNPTQGMGGYTLLDLGLRYHPYHHFRTHGILRIKNQFGQFWGEGTSVSVRELRIEGVAAKIVHFEIGDLDVKFSPFSLYTHDIYPENLPEIFRIRRRIQEYEGFLSNNQRRLQGATFFHSFISKTESHKLKSRVLFARTIPDQVAGENSMLLGGNVKYTRKEQMHAQLNLLSYFPLRKTNPEIRHYVASLDFFLLRPLSKKSQLTWEGEVALAQQEVLRNHRPQSVTGYSSLLKVKWEYKSLLKVSLAHLAVSPEFYSPGAQTSLYNYYQPTALFPYSGNVPLPRQPLVYDHLTQEDMLDQTIRTHLFPYFPQYNNLFPYGIGSPNRTGLFLAVQLQDRREVVETKLEGFVGNEVEGETTPDRRTFSQLTASLSLNMHNWAAWHKKLKIPFAFRRQQTKRLGPIDSLHIQLSSTFFSGGMEAEIVPDFFLLLGMVTNVAHGNEQMPLRSTTNEIYAIQKETWQEQQMTYSAGLQYRFGATSFLTFQMSTTRSADKEKENSHFQFRQAYLNFTLGF